MAWISAVNMDALSGKRHFLVRFRYTQADATLGPPFETSVYIQCMLKIRILIHCCHDMFYFLHILFYKYAFMQTDLSRAT